MRARHFAAKNIAAVSRVEVCADGYGVCPELSSLSTPPRMSPDFS